MVVMLDIEHGLPGSRLSTPEPEALAEKAEEAAGGVQAASQTGLGVAGMLRRIGLWAKEDAARGRITIAGRELLRWKRAADRWPPPACPFHDVLSRHAVVTPCVTLRTVVAAQKLLRPTCCVELIMKSL